MAHILILSADGFEQSELMEPRKALDAAGHKTTVASLKSGEIKGWKDKDWGDSVPVDLTVSDVAADDYDALLLPGGQMNPDILRMDEGAVTLVKAFGAAGKPIAAICHAPWLLVEADLLRGKTVTSWPSIRTSAMRAPMWWTRRSSPTATSSPAASRRIFPHSTRRCSAHWRTRRSPPEARARLAGGFQPALNRRPSGVPSPRGGGALACQRP